jgi:hypothetical protein
MGVGIDNTVVLKTATQETENLDKAIVSWSKGCKHVLTPAEQTHKHKMVDSGSSLYPWCSCTCPSPGICPGQRFTVFPNWLKGLGDGFGCIVWQAMALYRNRKKKQGPFKHANSGNSSDSVQQDSLPQELASWNKANMQYILSGSEDHPNENGTTWDSGLPIVQTSQLLLLNVKMAFYPFYLSICIPLPNFNSHSLS